ncbi:MAG TPA: acylneuraminate cytidylyltransferase family protein [Phycisphaerae bacterium]|nr:acylneuraminate cytidylyltransferase family protein [Phycisphaerae bacterium]
MASSNGPEQLPDSGILGVIPARGDSKRIPRKNIRNLCGRPLIVYTIEAAIRSGLMARVVVSTDSEEIARIAVQCGAEVPFLREASLADDHTPVSAATADVLQRIDPEASRFHTVAQLLPNCPLRNADDIRASHDQFVATEAEAQLSVTRYGWLNPWWAMQRDQGFRLELLFGHVRDKRSQDLPEVFCPTGAIWWARAEALRRHGTFHLPGYCGWEIPWQRAVDIDTEDDWRLAELLMRARLSGEEP